MITRNVVELDLQTERLVADYLKNNMDLFIASGSSRAVFTVDDGLAKILGHSFDDCVIKMSLGLGGYRQSKLEYNTYMENPDAPLADILARGSVFTVMEYVDTDYYFYEFYDEFNCDAFDYVSYQDEDDRPIEEREADERFQERVAEMEVVADVIWQLCNIFGETSDNCQLGKNACGDYVAYDYGFRCGILAREQMTRTSDYFSYSDDDTQEFFDLLISGIDEAIALGQTSMGEAEFETIEHNFVDFAEKE